MSKKTLHVKICDVLWPKIHPLSSSTSFHPPMQYKVNLITLQNTIQYINKLLFQCQKMWLSKHRHVSCDYLARGTLMLKSICHSTQSLLVCSRQVSHCGDIPFAGPFGGILLQVVGIAAMKQRFLLDSKVILK